MTPPTLEEVTAYLIELDSQIDPKAFHSYYETNGWVQGKGKPITNWRAAVTTWERNREAEISKAEKHRPRVLSDDEIASVTPSMLQG